MHRYQPARSFDAAAGYRALQRIAAVVRSEIDLGRALDLLAAEVGGHLDLTLCAVARWDDSGERLAVAHEYLRGGEPGSGPSLRGRRHEPGSHSACRPFEDLVFGQRRPWMSPGSAPPREPAPGESAGCDPPALFDGLEGCALAAAPMAAARGVVGLLLAARRLELPAWSEEEVEYLKACADLAAVAIQHVTARAAARALSAAAAEANSGSPRSAALRRLAEVAMTVTRSSGGLVALRAGDRMIGSDVCRGGRWEAGAVAFERGRGLGGWSWAHRAPCVANEAAGDPRADPADARMHGLRSVLMVPIVSPGGDVLGLLELHDRAAGEPYGEEEIHLATAVAHMTALALRADKPDDRD